MRRLSPLGLLCIALVIATAQVLPWLSLADPEVAAAESVFAGIIATAVSMISGRFPI
jgi:hypothetical protein